MNCKKCGEYIIGTPYYCPLCGHIIDNDKDTQSNTDPFEYNSKNQQERSSLFSQADFDKATKNNYNKFATSAMVFGILGVVCAALFFFGFPIVQWAAIILGNIAIVQSRIQKKLNYRNTTTGLILGIVSVSLGAFGAIIGILFLMLF